MLRGAFKERAPVKGRGWPSSLPPPCVTWILDSGELYALSHPTAPTIDNLKKKTEIIRLSLLGCSMWKPNWGALSWGPAREDLRSLAGAQPPQIMTLNCTQLSVFQHCLNNLTCGSITSSQPDWFALCPEAGDAISQTGLKSWEHQSHSGRHYHHCLRALLCARVLPLRSRDFGHCLQSLEWWAPWWPDLELWKRVCKSSTWVSGLLALGERLTHPWLILVWVG